MTETKVYEVEKVRYEFTPKSGPFKGVLVVRFPDLEPYTAEVNLTNLSSRNNYAGEAAEVCRIDRKQLKIALNALCTRRQEEVEAAAHAEQELATEEPEETPEVGEDEIDALIDHPGVLRRFVADAAEIHGVVGERAPLKLLTLNALGAQLERLSNKKPIGANVVLIAEWGRGKNHLCDAVATSLPEDFYLAFESASAKALYYRAEEDPQILAHRWIYLNEAEAMDQLVEMLRPLISGGKAVHLTVNKDSGGRNVALELKVEGPVTTTIPTIRNKLDPQLQSRMLTAELEDYEGRVARHSRKVSELLLPGYASEDFSPRIRTWKAALGRLTGIRRVVFPLDHEGFCFDRDDVTHGARLWANVLGLMCANAWLEQRNREVIELPDGEKAVVATPRDYAVAYGVFKATCERSVVNLSDTHRKILDAIYQLHLEDERREYFRKESWSQREIARRTGVPQSTISGQKSYLVKSLKLLVEEHNGKLRLADDVNPSWWKKEDALDGLPKPKQVRAWWNGDDDEPPDPETPDHSGHPHNEGEDHPDSGAKDDRAPAGHRQEPPGRSSEEPGHQGDRAGNPGDRDGPDQENGFERRENAPDEALIPLTGSLRSGEEASRAEGDRIAGGDPQERLGFVRKKLLEDEWESRPAREKLAILGWAHAHTFAPHESAGSTEQLAGGHPNPQDDPVARMLNNMLWLGESWAKTAARLFRWKPEGKSEEELRLMGWPSSPQEMHEHLEELAPVLQGKNPDCKRYPVRRDRFIHAEYWEKENADEGLWVFVPAHEGGRPRRRLRRSCGGR